MRSLLRMRLGKRRALDVGTVDVFLCFLSFQLRKAAAIFTPMVCVSGEFGRRWPTKMTTKLSRGGQLHMLYARASQAGRSHNYILARRVVGKRLCQLFVNDEATIVDAVAGAALYRKHFFEE
jgi:hypothetical protein